MTAIAYRVSNATSSDKGIHTKKANSMYRRYFAEPAAMAGDDSLSPNLPGLDLFLDFSSRVSSLDIRKGFRTLNEELAILISLCQELVLEGKR